VPEGAAPVVHEDMPLTLRVAAWPGEEFAGRVYFVAPAVDPQNRRVLLKADVPNGARRLRPGYFAEIRVAVARHEDALVVPESALVRDATGVFVWRLEADGTAARAPVELGLRHEGEVEVVAGLRPGDRVVSAGTHKVAAGMPLRTARAAPGVGGGTTAAP
jgi:membrane fusion protein (multidrug efflux system)